MYTFISASRYGIDLGIAPKLLLCFGKGVEEGFPLFGSHPPRIGSRLEDYSIYEMTIGFASIPPALPLTMRHAFRKPWLEIFS